MAINYNPTVWQQGTIFNPTNCNNFESGIKAACDRLDELGNIDETVTNATAGNGSRNLINPDANTSTIANVTCTRNGDGTYTLNGTSTNVIYLLLTTPTLPSGTYKFVVKGDTNTDYYGQCVTMDELSLVGGSGNEFGNGTILTLDAQTQFKVRVVLEPNRTFNNVVLKPMITRDLSATYATFEPYYMSNRQLSEVIPNINLIKIDFFRLYDAGENSHVFIPINALENGMYLVKAYDFDVRATRTAGIIFKNNNSATIYHSEGGTTTADTIAIPINGWYSQAFLYKVSLL